MIEAEHLTKRYGEKAAVDDLSFTVRPGIVTGFLGPNGSGKPDTELRRSFCWGAVAEWAGDWLATRVRSQPGRSWREAEQQRMPFTKPKPPERRVSTAPGLPRQQVGRADAAARFDGKPGNEPNGDDS